MAWSGIAQSLLAAEATHHHGSVPEHAPELIVVGVGFVAFLAYLHQERAWERQAGSGRARPDGLRWLTAALLVIAGLGHVPLIQQHLVEAPYMGVLFLLFVLCAIALAFVIVREGTAAEYAAALTLCVLAVGAYATTRLFSLPQLSDDVGAWFEPLGVMCVSTELAVVVIAGAQIHRLTASGRIVGRHAA